jgi:hypothetical protein
MNPVGILFLSIQNSEPAVTASISLHKFLRSGQLVYPFLDCPIVQMLKAHKMENISQDNGGE